MKPVGIAWNWYLCIAFSNLDSGLEFSFDKDDLIPDKGEKKTL